MVHLRQSTPSAMDHASAPPVFPGNGSHPWCPFPRASPGAQFPAIRSTIKALRLFRLRIPVAYLFRFRVRAILRSSCSPWRRPRTVGGTHPGQGICSAGRPFARHTLTRTPLRFSGDPSHPFAPVQDPGGPTKAPAIIISRLNGDTIEPK
jgi:hypothetical protein